MSNLYTDIFDPTRKEIWEKLGTVPQEGVLGGGTAIALQCGHRISYDFDIFLTIPIPKNLIRKVETVFPTTPIEVRIDSSDELTISLDEVKVTYVYYPFSALYPVQNTISLPLFDLRDSAANKAYTIGRRGAWRDYFDLYTICSTTDITLASIITDATTKFGQSFSAKLFLEQLTYLGDITDFSIETIKQQAKTPQEIISYFQTKTENLLK